MITCLCVAALYVVGGLAWATWPWVGLTPDEVRDMDHGARD